VNLIKSGALGPAFVGGVDNQKRTMEKPMKRLALACAKVVGLMVTLVLIVSPVVGGELSDEQLAQIEKVITRIKDQGHYPGVSVLIDKGGVSIYSAAFGETDMENSLAASVDSAYPIGSITKSFTALAALQLVASGQLDLEAPVNQYLHDFTGSAKEVRIWQLLNHTSGIPNYTSIPIVKDRLKRQKLSREQMVGFFADLPLQFEPGTRFSYTNSGFYLLGLIIEEVSGLSYYQYLQENVWNPLGMTRTYSGDDEQLIPGRVRGYEYGSEGFSNASPWHYLVPFSAGSIISTVADLARYRHRVFTSDVVGKKVLDLVVKQVPMKNGSPNPYTLGALIKSDFHGYQKYSHSGEIYGFFSDHAYYPDEDLTIAILTNHKGAAPTPVAMERKIARIVIGLPELVAKDVQLSTDELSQYAGNYYLEPLQFGPPVYGFVVTDGKLGISFGGVDAGGPVLPLRAQGNDQFVSVLDDEWLFTFVREGGEISGFESVARDATFFATRMQ